MNDPDNESGPAQWTEEWLQHGLESTPRYQTPADKLAMLAGSGTPIYDAEGTLVGMTGSTRIEQITETEEEK